MIDLLFNDTVQIAYACSTMITVVLTSIYFANNHHFMTDGVKKFCTTTMFVSLVLFAIGLLFNANVKYEKVYTSDWKQIYANDAKAEITLEAGNGVSFKAGSQLGLDYLKFKYSFEKEGKIIATDSSGTKKTKTFKLVDDDPIKVVGDLTEDSRITKVEYRPVKGTYKTVYSLQGPLEKASYDGEVRITVESSKESDELGKLFN